MAEGRKQEAKGERAEGARNHEQRMKRRMYLGQRIFSMPLASVAGLISVASLSPSGADLS
jgi:hypothetical protein